MTLTNDLALAFMILSACVYPARFEECVVSCAGDGTCPVGFTCSAEGLCHSVGAAETCAEVLGTFPSCTGLAVSCGPGRDEDCCSTASPITGGTFFRSHDAAADGMYSSTSYPATVSPFVLDRFEVTVGRFRKFVEAGLGTQANPPPSGAGARRLNGMAGRGGWDTSWNASLAADAGALIAAVKCNANMSWTDTPGANEELPINCVTWHEAFAFCVWDEGFLPTEAEWNFAASGGAEQRAFPWSTPPGSTVINCSFANYEPCSTGVGVRQVGYSPMGDGRYGQSDLDGNVAEWTLDEYQAAYPDPCVDCAFTGTTGQKTLRGGGFASSADALRTAVRNPKTSSLRGGDIGIRCAR